MVAFPLFHAGSGGSNPTSALSSKSLWFSKIEHSEAKKIIKKYHSRFPCLGGGGSRICYGAEFDNHWLGAAVWTNPSAPRLPQLAWMMLKRFAISDAAPKYTAGRMMGWMIRDIRGRFGEVETLVSYSDPDTHEGTIYRSTGWIDDGTTLRKGVGWKSRDRKYTSNTDCRRVTRWLYFMDQVKHEAEKAKRTGNVATV